MPIYEYRCENGHTFEVMQRMTDDPVAVCQTCGAPVQRVFHPVAVHFKGSGFYNTDYGRRGRTRDGDESAPAKESTKAGSDSKDSKATASTAKPASDGGAAAKPATDD